MPACTGKMIDRLCCLQALRHAVWLALTLVLMLGARSTCAQTDHATKQSATQPLTSETEVGEQNTPVHAEDDPEKMRALSDASIKAFAKGDYQASAKALEQLIALDGNNFVHYYNLACVRSIENKPDQAMELVVQAIEHGFTDIHLLKNDPALVNIRNTDAYHNMIEHWSAILDRRIDGDIERAKKIYLGPYTFTKDPAYRLAYACAYDQTTLAQVQAELARVHQWAMDHIFGEVNTDNLVDPDDPWVLIVLPTKKDFMAWSIATYGGDAHQFNQAIGGHYDNDTKQLVTMDLGSTLRHEYMHVLHWRDNMRHDQRPPIWIQEGLCSLIEDYDLGPDGELIPVESWRTNQARFLAETGHLLPLDQLAKLPRRRFLSSRPLAWYAQSRVFFLFLYRQGKLRQWYTHYVEHYQDDPTGIASVEAVFDEDIGKVHKEYAAFCKQLPKVAEEVRPGMASLGIEIDATGTGEGLEISGYIPQGRAGDLKRGDIVTHIDSRPTRDYWELIRVLTSYEPGQIVRVTYHRGTLHNTTEIQLKAAK